METEVIKSFLVGLGFGVDEKTLAKFNKSIAEASVKVAALSTTVAGAAAGIFYGITRVASSFEQMGYELRLVAPAVNRFLVMRQAMLTAYAKAGVNLTKVVQQSILFNYSLAKTKFAIEAIWKSVAARFFPMLTKQMDIFRLKIFANMPKIQAQLEKLIKFVFKAFSAVLELGHTLWDVLQRLYGFFAMLHEKTHGWSTVILAALAAWRLLNLGFLATPLGAIIGLGLALLTLYDDLEVFLKGGKSLINWGSDTTKMIVGILAVINPLARSYQLLKLLGSLLGWLGNAVVDFFQKFEFGRKILELFKDALESVVGGFKVIGSFIGSIIGPLFDMLKSYLVSTGGNVLATLGNADAAGLQRLGVNQPLASTGSNKSLAIHQETNINVQGVSDAHTVGANVASAQSGINRDLIRYGQGGFLR